MQTDRAQDSLDVDSYLIQQGRMRLVEAIVGVDTGQAVTRAVVKRSWPLFKDGRVSPMIIVELVAQTAGINIRWNELQKDEDAPPGGGLLVGIKKADFFIDAIAGDSVLITRAKKGYRYLNYAEYTGVTAIDEESIAEVVLQVVRTD